MSPELEGLPRHRQLTGLGRAIARPCWPRAPAVASPHPTQLPTWSTSTATRCARSAGRHDRRRRAAVQVAVDAFGQLDVLVNNAGYANLASVEDITRGLPRADRHQPARRGEPDQGGAAVLREQGAGTSSSVLVGGRAPASIVRVPGREWAVGGSPSAQPGGRAAGHQGHGAGAGRHAYRLGGSSMAVRPVSEHIGRRGRVRRARPRQQRRRGE